MVKSKLYSNLKQAIGMLDGLLIPEGSKELSYWGSEEDELNLLQEEISALDYSCLDEVYHGGLKEVINDNLSPAENALISGVGLLDEYGLSEEEFREWLEKQPEVYSLLLGILITGKWPDISQWQKMEDYFEEEYPEKEQGRHEYIDYISALRSGQRNLEIAVSDLSQFQKNALYTANKAATSAVNRFANSFMDSAHASKEQRTFAEKLKAVFDTEQYERAIDMIFRAFGDTVMTLPDEDRMSGNVCELGTYQFGYRGDCDFLRHLKFWSATKKVKKLLAELPENETWDIPAMENNETIVKLLKVLVDNFNIELYKNLYTREIENMFAQKGSYAFYIQWLNNEFPSEVEYQKKLKDAKGIKKILVAASKPNHLATIE